MRSSKVWPVGTGLGAVVVRLRRTLTSAARAEEGARVRRQKAMPRWKSLSPPGENREMDKLEGGGGIKGEGGARGSKRLTEKYVNYDN
jgi:hypothetical protein